MTLGGSTGGEATVAIPRECWRVESVRQHWVSDRMAVSMVRRSDKKRIDLVPFVLVPTTYVIPQPVSGAISCNLPIGPGRDEPC